MKGQTRIVPILVGDSNLCKRASDMLLLELYGIYVQSTKLSNRAARAERLRITPGPFHNMGLINEFVTATVAVWRQLGLPFGMNCASTARRA